MNLNFFYKSMLQFIDSKFITINDHKTLQNQLVIIV